MWLMIVFAGELPLSAKSLNARHCHLSVRRHTIFEQI